MSLSPDTSTVGYLDYGSSDLTADDVARTILTALATRIPGWRPGSESVLEVALAEELGRLIADLTYLAQIDEPARMLREFGTTVAAVPYRAGTAAVLPVRFTLTAAGQSIPADMVVAGTTTDGIQVRFVTDAAATAGSAATTVVVPATAADVGEFGNGVPAGPLTVVTGTGTVISAAALTPSTGGSDPESDAEYLNRLVAAQGLLTRSVVLAADAAVQARSLDGVHRALGVDNYDATTGQSGQERTLSVFVVDDSGGPTTSAAKAQLKALLESLREVNFIIRVADPAYVPVTVAFTAHAQAGYDPATVQSAAIARVYELLDPARWAGGEQDPPQWTGARVVRYLDLAAEIDRVDGVDYVDTLTINGAAGDLTLTSGTSPAVLPASQAAGTTVTGTVST